jgi:hypothetical protein
MRTHEATDVAETLWIMVGRERLERSTNWLKANLSLVIHTSSSYHRHKDALNLYLKATD